MGKKYTGIMYMNQYQNYQGTNGIIQYQHIKQEKDKVKDNIKKRMKDI